MPTYDYACAACGAASCRKLVKSGYYFSLLATACRWQYQPRRPGIYHYGYPVLIPHLVYQQLHRLFQQRELVSIVHRAGHIYQEHKVRGRQVTGRYIFALKANL